MAFIRIDDGMPEHPKVLRAGGEASWMHVCGIAYANRRLTDGFVPTEVVCRLTDAKRPVTIAERLVSVGLWTAVDGGYQIHDYLDHQTAADDVRRKRDEATTRKKASRVRHSPVTPPSQRDTGVRHAPVTPPSHSLEEEEETEEETDPSSPWSEGEPAPVKGGPALPRDPELPDRLRPYLDPVCSTLARVAVTKPGAAEPTVAAVANVLRRFPAKDFIPLALDYEHWAVHGRGGGRPVKDVVRAYSKWIEKEPDVLRKSTPGAGGGIDWDALTEQRLREMRGESV